MNQQIIVWVFVTVMFSALSTGCTTGPEIQSSSDKNHESEDKKLEESGYY
ncbi:MAG: hypothetical protein H8E42_13720 [Nitrospinae bacterium]|nr:hypothetical protein [Nitrospinota bacterium]MBL7021455.1 hypothetical protein [Nitrospinaceae bacterium]